MQKLINKFKNISFTTVEATYLEISGYPHYENVCSNILTFFFDPTNAHKMKDLMLISLNPDISFSNVRVFREVTTYTGKRIDIIIESENDVIAIENKIYHNIENPFDDYNSYLDKKYINKNIHKYILGINIENNKIHEDFIQVDYSFFMNSIKNNIGNYLTNVNQKYLSILIDFIESIENLSKGTRMEEKELLFIKENEHDIVKINSMIFDFKKEIRNKVNHLLGLQSLKNEKIKSTYVYRETDGLFDIFVYELIVKDIIVAIDTIISPQGWRIEIFPRNNEQERTIVKNILESSSIKFIEKDRFEYYRSFEFTENIEIINKSLEDIISKILNITKT